MKLERSYEMEQSSSQGDFIFFEFDSNLIFEILLKIFRSKFDWNMAVQLQNCFE